MVDVDDVNRMYACGVCPKFAQQVVWRVRAWSCWRQGSEHCECFGACAGGVEEVEGCVAEVEKDGGGDGEEGEGVVCVADYFGYGPGEDH